MRQIKENCLLELVPFNKCVDRDKWKWPNEAHDPNILGNIVKEALWAAVWGVNIYFDDAKYKMNYECQTRSANPIAIGEWIFFPYEIGSMNEST